MLSCNKSISSFFCSLFAARLYLFRNEDDNDAHNISFFSTSLFFAVRSFQFSVWNETMKIINIEYLSLKVSCYLFQTSNDKRSREIPFWIISRMSEKQIGFCFMPNKRGMQFSVQKQFNGNCVLLYPFFSVCFCYAFFSFVYFSAVSLCFVTKKGIRCSAHFGKCEHF